MKIPKDLAANTIRPIGPSQEPIGNARWSVAGDDHRHGAIAEHPEGTRRITNFRPRHRIPALNGGRKPPLAAKVLEQRTSPQSCDENSGPDGAESDDQFVRASYCRELYRDLHKRPIFEI
ncbi:hypothetical protein [Nocardia alni]|uniref:hypothetical protein n=1 Tax=Nocardia alni TaxID=2815723 RepID=UPI001C2178CD|nr:hypothetical protein [Nocardia alni]